MAEPLRIAAPAKLNLFLHITGKRADGYHLLESLAVFTTFGDWLEISPAESLTLESKGPMAGGLQADNLALRAARLLQSHAGCKMGAQIALHKHIPIGAGLGGGSADAAAALRGLNKLWGLSLNDESLRILALQLGSDVPVCIGSQAAWMRGVGEMLELASCPPLFLLLLNPNQPLLTADIFRRFGGNFEPPCMPPSADRLLPFLQAQRNSLQPAAIEALPVIGDMLAAIEATQGCLFARMSGSGATCFSVYINQADVQAAAQHIHKHHPNWWCKATETHA